LNFPLQHGCIHTKCGWPALSSRLTEKEWLYSNSIDLAAVPKGFKLHSMERINLRVNGQRHSVAVDPQTPLLFGASLARDCAEQLTAR
jgi:hypothetical protein